MLQWDYGKKKITISVAIATYNEAIKLGACLASIGSWVDEIVLVDGGSSDGTLEIAKKFGAVISKRDNPVMFHINKNRAIAMCKSDWILQLDADEVVGNDLSEEIRSVIKKKNTNAGYQMPRKNFSLVDGYPKVGNILIISCVCFKTEREGCHVNMFMNRSRLMEKLGR